MTRLRLVLGVVAVVVVVTIPLVASSCERARDTAEVASQEFRSRALARAYGEIFKAATPEFQKVTTEGDFAQAMNAARENLGAWESSERRTWKVFAGTSGQTVTLVYTSYFERGTATEEFVWRIQKGRSALAGYHVKSSTLSAH